MNWILWTAGYFAGLVVYIGLMTSADRRYEPGTDAVLWPLALVFFVGYFIGRLLSVTRRG